MTTDGQDDTTQLNIHSEIHLECCENCQEWVNDEEMALVEVYTSKSGLVKMNVCDHCARPVQLELVHLRNAKVFWIYYLEGLGKNRKEIEATGSTEEEALQNFRENWANIMNRDLVNFTIKKG